MIKMSRIDDHFLFKVRITALDQPRDIRHLFFRQPEVHFQVQADPGYFERYRFEVTVDGILQDPEGDPGGLQQFSGHIAVNEENAEREI